jgi:hypothetical protein
MTQELCTIRQCNQEAYRREMCGVHYRHFLKNGGDRVRKSYGAICSVEGCNNEHHARGYCNPHFMRFTRYGNPLGQPLPKKPKPKQICMVEGCEEVYRSKGYCYKHYTRWLTHGDPLYVKVEMIRGTIEERFWPKVNKTKDCWLWTAGKDLKGYGSFSINGKSTIAHRVAYELTYGAIPKGMEIDHTCHNESDCHAGTDCPHRACVRPDHLEAISHDENIRRSKRNSRNYKRTHCKNGHEFTPENTFIRENGTEMCRTCARARYKRYHEKHPRS